MKGDNCYIDKIQDNRADCNLTAGDPALKNSDPDNNNAIASLILGLISLCTLGGFGIFSIPAIICGSKGIKKALKQNNRGLYVAGFGIAAGGYSIFTVLCFLLIIIQILHGLGQING